MNIDEIRKALVAKGVLLDEGRSADARLIEAAPDMLAALKNYAQWFTDPATCDDPALRPLRQAVLAAIAKAEGKP